MADEPKRDRVVTEDIPNDKGEVAGGDTLFKSQVPLVDPRRCQEGQGVPEESACGACCKVCGGELPQDQHICPFCDSYLGLQLKVQDAMFRCETACNLAVEFINITKSTLRLEEYQISCDSFEVPARSEEPGWLIGAGAKRKNLFMGFTPLRLGEPVVNFLLCLRDSEGKPIVLKGQQRICVWGDTNAEKPSTNNVVNLNINEGYGVNIDGLHFTGAPKQEVTQPPPPEWLLPGQWRTLYLQVLAEATGMWRPENRRAVSHAATPIPVRKPKGGWLRLTMPDGRPRAVYLHFEPEIKLGRGPDQDISCVLRNRDGSVCKPETILISARHLTLGLSEAGAVVLQDHSSNGTLVAGEEIKKNSINLHHGQEFSLAGLMSFRYREFRDLNALYQKVRSMRFATRLTQASKIDNFLADGGEREYPLNAFRLRRVGVGRNRFEYFVVFKELEVGRDPCNALVLPHESVGDNHAKIVMHEGLPRLVDLGRGVESKVDGHRLEPHHSRTLTDGCQVSVGQVAGSFQWRYSENY